MSYVIDHNQDALGPFRQSSVGAHRAQGTWPYGPNTAKCATNKQVHEMPSLCHELLQLIAYNRHVQKLATGSLPYIVAYMPTDHGPAMHISVPTSS